MGHVIVLTLSQDVKHVDVLLDPVGRSKGCAIVEYSSPAEAQRAIDELNHTINSVIQKSRFRQWSGSSHFQWCEQQSGGDPRAVYRHARCGVESGRGGFTVSGQAI
eukprot:767178-Hanusia_phi.AAC.9